MGTIETIRKNASFFAVFLAIAITTIALVVATVSLLMRM